MGKFQSDTKLSKMGAVALFLALCLGSCAEKKEDEYKADLTEVASPSEIEKEVKSAPLGIHESNDVEENTEDSKTNIEQQAEHKEKTQILEDQEVPGTQEEANPFADILPKLKPEPKEPESIEAQTQPEAPILEDAKKVTTTQPPKEEKKPAVPTLYIIVSKKQQRLWIYENGSQTHSYTWLVSTGSETKKCPPQKGSECYIALTPNGEFTPDRAYRHYKSKQWKAKMDFAVFFNGGIALHATYGEEHLNMLGKKDSGGCVRQRESDAEITFNTVKKHGLEQTRVIVQD